MIADPDDAAEMWALNGRTVPGTCHVLVSDPEGELPPVVHEERPALFVVPSGLFDMPRIHYDLDEREDFFDEVSHKYYAAHPENRGLS